MKTIPCALLLAAAASCAFAQTLAPELAPLAAKYQADISVLDAQRETALAQAQRPYTVALAAAEKSATTSGKVAAVAAIAAERDALGSGLMAPGFPPGLPKELQMSRKSYFDANVRNRAAELPRRQAIDAEYLRALTQLQARAGGNLRLAKQVAAEKENLLAASAANTRAGGKPNAKSAVVNGTFDLVDAEGRPSGWKIAPTEDPSIKVVRDGANNVLRESSDIILYKGISQEIPVPPRAKSMILSARVRGKWETRDTTHMDWGAGVNAVSIGADDQPVGDWIGLPGGRDVGWKSLSQTGKIPSGSKAVRVICALKFISGSFDFDDIAIEFR